VRTAPDGLRVAVVAVVFSWWDGRHARAPGTPARRGGRMTTPPPSVRAVSADEFRSRLPEFIAIYAAAMRYPPGIVDSRMGLWEEHSRREGFACQVVDDPDGTVGGMTYGYTGRPGQWWYSEVSRGLGVHADAWMSDFFELTELHVRPDRQGAGIGQRLLVQQLRLRPERSVLLSTPEGTNRAWRLYRRTGFVDVLRDYRFAGDPRPFGVLGRPLPLEPDLLG
jgi:ribosomal protein S18 acetylase RimI-like enzyme